MKWFPLHSTGQTAILPSIEGRIDEIKAFPDFFVTPTPKSWPFSSRWRNLVRFEWHLRMRGMSRHPRFLAPPIPSVLWPRLVTEMSRNPEYATSGPHARQPVQFSSLRHISLAKNKFLLFFFIILPLISPEMLTFLFAGQAGRELPWRRHYRATDYRREGGYKSISPSLNTLHFRLIPD